MLKPLLRIARLLFALYASIAMATAATLPTDFVETQIASGVSPTAITLAPDGRVFVSSKEGHVYIIKNGALLPTPFLTLTVNSDGERGVSKLVLDPDFATNHWVYLYYTATTPAIHNRVSRFTANGDVAVAGSEVVLLELPNLNATNHNGGSMLFVGQQLYISTGDNANRANAQSLATPLGKILRINKDGSIPTNNPYYNTSGAVKSIYALGLRNPFKLTRRPSTGQIYLNDVGENTWEEVNLLTAGKNYGWPITEGYKTSGQTAPANYQDPVFVYNHTDGCSITGGAFYEPATSSFPGNYVGQYFYQDYCSGYMKLVNLATGDITDFAGGIDGPTDVEVAPDGSVYYSSINTGGVWHVTYNDVPEPAGSAYAWSWLRRGGSTGVDRFNRIRTAPDGSVYAAGAFTGTATFDGKSGGASQTLASSGGLDGVLARYTKTGVLSWAIKLGSSGDDEVLSLATDQFGYAYVTGYFTGSMTIVPTTGASSTLVSAGGRDAFVAKIHPDGHIGYAFRFGSTGNDAASGIDVTPDLRFYVAGSFIGTTTVQGVFGTAVTVKSRGNSDAFLAKFSNAGSMYWLIQAGGTGNDFAYGAAAAPSGEGFLVGSYEGTASFNSSLNSMSISKTSAGGSDGFVLGVSVPGDLNWVASLGGPINDNLTDVAPDPRGTGLVAVGGFSGTATFGNLGSIDGLGYYDAFAVRLTSDGAFSWVQRAGGVGQDQAWGVRVDKRGNALVAASFSATARAFGSGTNTLTSAGGTDILVTKLDAANGKALWSATAGGTGDDRALGIDTGATFAVLAAGNHGAAARFGTFGPYADLGLGEAWAGRYAPNISTRQGVEEMAAQPARLHIYPNPAQAGAARIYGASADTQVRIFATDGRLLHQQTTSAEEMSAGLALPASLTPGLYLVRCGADVQRLVVE